MAKHKVVQTSDETWLKSKKKTNIYAYWHPEDIVVCASCKNAFRIPKEDVEAFYKDMALDSFLLFLDRHMKCCDDAFYWFISEKGAKAFELKKIKDMTLKELKNSIFWDGINGSH